MSQKIQAYRNLKKRCWSIRQGAKVIGWSDEVYLVDVEFRVSEKRRQAVIAQGAREVHAYVSGERVEGVQGEFRRFTYHPFRSGNFVDCESGEAIFQAKAVKLKRDGKAYYQPVVSNPSPGRI